MACSSCKKRRAQFKKQLEERKRNILEKREQDVFEQSLEGLTPIQKRRKQREERARCRKVRAEARKARIQRRNAIKENDAKRIEAETDDKENKASE